jgi:hypothetical protein
VGVHLTKRDASRFRVWHAGLLALVFAMLLGGIRSGASWGATAYNPASDPYSMQNITTGDGVQAWWNAGYTGQGVGVAVIDTGVAPVAGLSSPGKVMNGPDLSLESQNPSLQNLDTNGHGTFMAGLIAGNDGQPGGYRGVAPDAHIVSLKVGVADGGTDVSQVIAAIDWVVQHRNDSGMNIRVLNLSTARTRRSRTSLTHSPTQSSRLGRRASSSLRQPATLVIRLARALRGSPIRAMTPRSLRWEQRTPTGRPRRGTTRSLRSRRARRAAAAAAAHPTWSLPGRTCRASASPAPTSTRTTRRQS